MIGYKVLAARIAKSLGYIPEKWEDVISVVEALAGHEEELRGILKPAVYHMQSPHSQLMKKMYGLDNEVMSKEELSKASMITRARLGEIETEAIDRLTHEYGIELLLERI